jgi:hypothetical protein
MKAVWGTSLVVICSVCLSTTCIAQTISSDRYATAGYLPAIVDTSVFPQGPGGFGYHYTEGPPASGVFMNQWGLIVGEIPLVPATVSSTAASAPTQPQTGRIVRSVPQQRYLLTRGFLGWPGTSTFGIYPPSARGSMYGSGYAHSPYGTNNYFGGFRGYTLGD